jgi:hypothetical protein
MQEIAGNRLIHAKFQHSSTAIPIALAIAPDQTWNENLDRSFEQL